jgi:hypothetical protein
MAVYADCYKYPLIIFQLIVDTQCTHREVPGSVRIWWNDLWYLRFLVSVNYGSLSAPGFSANRTKENHKHHKQKFVKTQLCSPSKHICIFKLLTSFWAFTFRTSDCCGYWHRLMQTFRWTCLFSHFPRDLISTLFWSRRFYAFTTPSYTLNLLLSRNGDWDSL